MGEYVELHAVSAFSFLRGASVPPALAEAARACGLGAMALTDRNGLYGTARFHKAASEAGVRPIVGAELSLRNGDVIPVLVRNRTGYRNLCRFLTRGQLAASKGAAVFDLEELGNWSEGLVALTGDAFEGVFRPGATGWTRKLAELRAAFPGEGQLYVELNHHLRRGDDRRVRDLCALADAADLPVVATNAVLYARRSERVAGDFFTCLRNGVDVDGAGGLLAANAERHVKSALSMERLFAGRPEAVRNTRRLAERLEFTLHDLGYEFPRHKVPAGETMDSFLRKMVWFGAEQRYGSLGPEVRRQLEHELGIIGRLGFAGYFLIVWDIVNFCRETGVMVQGRGSAANSAVCYSLGITAVDPIANKLLFERFLSEGRSGWPDIDLDLPGGERRESVIREVYRRYGKHGAAMTANVITYRSRSAVREVGKVLGFPPEAVDRFADLYSEEDYPETPDFREQLTRAGIHREHPRISAFAGLYRLVRGLPRHLGQHSGGMIVCEGELDGVVPLENASMPGRVVAQWDKDDCEEMGIVKVDLLGLGMMAVLQDSLEMVRARGRALDLARIPKDDPATFECMRNADTIGVFQIESRAQQATLPRMKPACFYDVAIEVAIVRPGPIQGELIHPYLARRQGREAVTYAHPELKPVLERTLGVPLYQEQILRIAMILADFTGEEADELRRALNFHRSPERLERVRAKLRRAMEEKGMPEETIDWVVRATGSFALYGFPESHAISFALLVYASTYLKTHHPAEFYCGLLNNQPMGFYSPATLVQDARRRGLRFLAPCVVESGYACTVTDEGAIRLGLQWVRGVSAEKLRRLVETRRAAPFGDLREFRKRTDFDAGELRRLGLAGALNRFSGDRRSALWEVAEVREDDLLAEVETVADGGRGTGDPPVAAMNALERVAADYEAVGLTVGRHPMGMLRKALPELWRAADLPKGRNGWRVEIGGAVICRQRPGTAGGFVFVSVEDETGIASAVLAPDFFEKHRGLVTGSVFLGIRGRLQNVDGVIHVRAEEVRALDGCDLEAGASMI